ncbi:MAG: PAS domain S-box protein [Mesonia hippocampi]|uniref:sensor histidine kinase n=1 Tax=Mesonia hippocampi TaxID=1628250 RepID=UPI003F9E8E0E
MKHNIEEMAFLQSVAHIGSWYWNLQTDKRTWSDEYYKICGLSPKDDVLNAEIAQNLIHPEDRKNAVKAINDAIENKVSYTYEKRIIRSDGKVRHIIAKGNATYDTDGEALQLLGTIQDVTEQKETRLQLQESLARNKALLAAIPDMMFIQDFKGNYKDCFVTDTQKLFMPPAAFIGKNMIDVLPTHVFKLVKNAHELAIKNRELQVVEYSVKNEEGEHFFEARVIHLNRHGILTIVRDITEKKHKEAQIIQNEAKTTALLNTLPDLMIVYDKQGNHLEVHAPNKFQLVAPYDEHIGRNIDVLLPKEVCEIIRQGFADCERTKKLQTLEYCLIIDDKLRHLESRKIQTDEGNFLTVVRDVTEKKMTENLLFLKDRALAATSSGIIISDARQPDMPIIYANDVFVKTTGYENAEIIGKNCRFLQGEDRDQNEIKVMARAIQKGEKCQVALRNYRRDGSLFWNEVSLTPIYNDKKILTHFIGVQNDITARKVEELFKIGQSHIMDMIIKRKPLKNIGDKIIKTIQDAIPNCISSILLLDKEDGTLHKLAAPNLPQTFSKAIEGITIGFNVGSCGTAAHIKKEVIVNDIENDPLWEQYKAFALADNLRACWSFPIFSSNQEILGTFALYFNTLRKPLTAEKEIVYSITRATSIAIEQYNINLALENSRDELVVYSESLENKVAERTTELQDMVQKLVESNLTLEDQVKIITEAENKALTSQKLLATIFKNFPKGFVAVVDADFKIIFIEGEELTDLGFKHLVSTNATIDMVKTVPVDIREIVKNNIQKTLKGEHCSFEIHFQERTYLVNTTPLLDEQNTITQVLVVHNNITQQKEVEEEIRNTLQKEKELNELKSRFIATASHEFRTPLSVILSSATLIEKQNEAGNEKKREKYLGKIKANVRSLVTILNDFLSLSKLEEGKVMAKPEYMNLSTFSESAINDIKPNRKKGQKIKLVENNTVLEADLDPKLLKHILFNLLSNAIKYSPEDSEISLILSKTEDAIILEVSDKGIGIAEEDHKNMFQRFFRAKNATNIQGTGLGLNIVKQYTELMGGTISFKSKINEGTCFKIVLPINNKPNEKNTYY